MRFPHLLRSPPSSPPASLSQLSFAEVMQLVQEGKEVPGVTKPDVQPSNQSPTPSQMQRKLNLQKPKSWFKVRSVVKSGFYKVNLTLCVIYSYMFS
uniref:Peroxisomal membrane protein PEX14-like KPWE domain-containing protein n=1 Tax=Xiphophorus maculatus TaxID=8083 RepID=A0A3B5PWU4_XIPMA